MNDAEQVADNSNSVPTKRKFASFLGEFSRDETSEIELKTSDSATVAKKMLDGMSTTSLPAVRVSLAEMDRQTDGLKLPLGTVAGSTMVQNILAVEGCKKTPTNASKAAEIIASRMLFSSVNSSSMHMVTKPGNSFNAIPAGDDLYSRAVISSRGMGESAMASKLRAVRLATARADVPSNVPYVANPHRPMHARTDSSRDVYKRFANERLLLPDGMHRQSDLCVQKDTDLPMFGPLAAVLAELQSQPGFREALAQSIEGEFDLYTLLFGGMTLHPQGFCDADTQEVFVAGITGPALKLLEQALVVVGVPGIVFAETHELGVDDLPPTALTAQFQQLPLDADEQTLRALCFPNALPSGEATSFTEARRLLMPTDSSKKAPISYSHETPNRWFCMQGTLDSTQFSVSKTQAHERKDSLSRARNEQRNLAQAQLKAQPAMNAFERRMESILEGADALPPPSGSNVSPFSHASTDRDIAGRVVTALETEAFRGAIGSMGTTASRTLPTNTLPVHPTEDLPSSKAPAHVDPTSGRAVQYVMSHDIQIYEKDAGQRVVPTPDIPLFAFAGTPTVHVSLVVAATNEFLNPTMRLGHLNSYKYTTLRPRASIVLATNDQAGVKDNAAPDGLGKLLDRSVTTAHVSAKSATQLEFVCKTNHVFRTHNVSHLSLVERAKAKVELVYAADEMSHPDAHQRGVAQEHVRSLVDSGDPVVVANEARCNACGACSAYFYPDATGSDTKHVLTIEPFVSASPELLLSGMKQVVKNVLDDASPYFQDILPASVLQKLRLEGGKSSLPESAPLVIHKRTRKRMHGRDAHVYSRNAFTGEWLIPSQVTPSAARNAGLSVGLSF
jgi:hypothetical protein